jgi:hypothetical protein
MPPENKLLGSQPFSHVLAVELDAARRRRLHVRDPRPGTELEAENATPPVIAAVPIEDAALKEVADQKTQRLTALHLQLVGLAISGGGIRSATFALGLLQGLAELDMLKRFDYISTVSGGGYIGGWLAAWTKREGDIANVYQQLRPWRDEQSLADRPPLPKGPDGVVDEEPEPIRHLRLYSSYLAPRTGIYSPDTWSLIAIYTRNLLLNLLILLPATVVVVTLVRLALLFFRAPTVSFASGLNLSELLVVGIVSLVFLFAMSLVFNVIGMEFFKIQEARNRRKSLGKTPAKVRWLAGIVLVAFLATVAAVIIWNWGCAVDLLSKPWAILFLPALSVILLMSAVCFLMAQYKLRTAPKPPIGVYRLLWYVIIPLIVAAVLGCWLFSIDPISRTGDVVVDNGIITRMKPGADVFLPDASNFATRLQSVGYKVLVAPFNPPAFLADQAPSAGADGTSVDQNALKGWKEGRIYWWPALVLIGFFSFMHGTAHLYINWDVFFRLLADGDYGDRSPPYSTRRVGMVVTFWIASFVSGALGGFLIYILVVKGLWTWHHQPQALVTFGPPLALLLFLLSVIVEIGVLGRRLEEDEREWWAMFGALVLLAAVSWVLLFAVVLYVPWLFSLVKDRVIQTWLKGGLTFGWLATSIGGAMAGRSPSTGNNADKDRGITSILKELLAQVAPYVFLVGLLAGISMLVGHFIDVVDVEFDLPNMSSSYWAAVGLAGFVSLIIWCVGSGLFALSMSSLINVNLFSLHNMYANRLIRAYLGASRKKKAWVNRWEKGTRPLDRCGAPTNSQGDYREENPISGFDFDDDFPLLELRTGRPSGDLKLPAYWGPLPLINTALNLVATRELDWQERLAESFVLSPLYCGSQSTGYQLLPDDFRRGNMTLGRAVAISGAAADPNMGHHTSPAVMALMTVLNTRLGWWIENPSRPLGRWETAESAKWAAESPMFGGLILKELTGQTDSVGNWVHLSDGGHFENLGAYELIRRRCRYIVVSDGGCDPNLEFEDLANLIRKCRTDFGIRIEIDTAPIKKTAAGHSHWHCAIGKIRYDDVDGGEVPGMLVYVKSSMTGDEPPDLQQYARRDPTFPHQTTANQFFDETQFESYRTLGVHVAQQVFGQADADPAGDPERTNPGVFSRLRNRWFPAPPELEANFDKIAEAYDKLQRTMAADPHLRAFTHDLYPELGPAPTVDDLNTQPFDRICAELHTVNQVLLLMEKAWIAVKLEGFPEHPMNRGWMNEFRRYASSTTVRRLWPTLRGTFSQEFVRFCEQELMLPGQLPAPVKLTPANDPHRSAYESLQNEFAREWPSRHPNLQKLIQMCESSPDDHHAWLIINEDPQIEDRTPFAYGIAVKARVGHEESGPVHEITLWVRPAYRNLRIGRACFQKLFPRDASFSETLRVR